MSTYLKKHYISKSLSDNNPYILILFFSLIMFFKLKNGLIGYWDHILPPIDPNFSLQMDLSLWDYNLYGGRFFAYLAQFPYHAFVFFFKTFFGNWANTIVFWGLYFVSGLSMYIFVKNSLTYDDFHNTLAALIASFLYLFNPYYVLRFDVEPMSIFILSFLPLTLHLARKTISIPISDFNNKLIYGIKTAVITFYMIPGYSIIESGLITTIFVVAYMVVFAVRNNKLESLFYSVFIISIFSIIIHFWWIFPNLIHSSVKGAFSRSTKYILDSLGSLRVSSEHINYFNVFRNFPYPLSVQNVGNALSTIYPSSNYYGSSLIVFLTLLYPIVGGSSLIKENRDKSESIIFYTIFILFIPIFFTGFNKPFDFLVEWLLYNVPLYVFRRPDTYTYIINFVSIYLFSVGFSWLYIKLKGSGNIRSKIILAFIFVSVFVVIPFPVLKLDSANVLLRNENDEQVAISTNFQIPDYVEDSIKYLNTVSEKGGILVLPRVGSMRAYNWDSGYFGPDVYYLSVDRPILTHYYWGRQQTDLIYDEIQRYINTQNGNFSELLYVLNIKYIILVEDSLTWGNNELNLTSTKTYLNNSENISLLEQFNKHSIYESTYQMKNIFELQNSISIKKYNYEIYANSVNYSYTNIYDFFINGDGVKIDDDSVKINYVYDENRYNNDWFVKVFSLNGIISDIGNYVYITTKVDSNATLGVSISDNPNVIYYQTPINSDLVKNAGDVYVEQFKTYIYGPFKYDRLYIKFTIQANIKEEFGSYNFYLKNITLNDHLLIDDELSFSEISKLLIESQKYLDHAFVNETISTGLLLDEEIEIVKISPTKYKLTSNDNLNKTLLSTPFFYDEGWTIQQNENIIQPIKVNKLFLGWVISAEKNETIIIYYKPQKQFEQYFYLSICSFNLLCVLLLVYRYRIDHLISFIHITSKLRQEKK